MVGIAHPTPNDKNTPKNDPANFKLAGPFSINTINYGSHNPHTHPPCHRSDKC